MPADRAQQDQAYRQRRMERGNSEACASSHHDRCTAPACTCRCHTDPEGFKRGQDRTRAARQAWETRRARGTDHTRKPKPADTGETAPNRPELEAGHKPALAAAAAKQIKSEAALLLWLADQGAAQFAPKLWTTPEDRLQDDERTLLVNNTYAYLESTAWGRRLLKLLNKASESAPLAALIYSVAMVAAPRLAHHKVIPVELASAIVFAPLLFQQSTSADGSDTSTSPGMESERTPEPDRADWHREVDAGGIPFTVPPVQSGPPVETGHGPLRHPTNGENGAVPRGHPL